jgi:uncharacterized protein DUF5994
MRPDLPAARPPSTTDQPSIAQTTGIAAPYTAERLRLRAAAGPTTGHVDGGWWPHSRNLVREVPALFAALPRRLGPIALIAYNLNDWDATPRTLECDGARLEGISHDTSGPHTIVMLGTDGRCITLLLVPPNADQTTGHQALASVSLPDHPQSSNALHNEARETTSQALTDLAARLSRRESSTHRHSLTTITAWVQEAAQQFIHAPIQTYVPILVEHIVRERLATTNPAP